MNGPPTTQRDRLRVAWPCLAAAVFVLAMVACRFDSKSGFTELIRFGSGFEERRLESVSEEPIHVFPNPGYDGQFYAQLAVDPAIGDPAVQTAMDSPRYRARRILLPVVVHVLGFGNTWAILNLYALANLLVWLALGWFLWARVRDDGTRGSAIWLACMLSLGALDSVRMSLTDLPALLLLFLAVEASRRGRRLPALVSLAAAVLTREASVIALAAAESGSLRSANTWRRHASNLLLIGAPIAAWSAWIAFRIPGGGDIGSGNLGGPFIAIGQHVAGCISEIAHGNLDSRFTFGLLAVPVIVLQMLWIGRRAIEGDWTKEPWVRAALPFALLVLVLGTSVWHGYWAVARSCLPLTFAFNLTLPRDRRFWPLLITGNLTVLHGIYRMLPNF